MAANRDSKAHGGELLRRLAVEAARESGLLVDVHTPALERSRKRAALAAYDRAVAAWAASAHDAWDAYVIACMHFTMLNGLLPVSPGMVARGR